VELHDCSEIGEVPAEREHRAAILADDRSEVESILHFYSVQLQCRVRQSREDSSGLGISHSEGFNTSVIGADVSSMLTISSAHHSVTVLLKDAYSKCQGGWFWTGILKNDEEPLPKRASRVSH